MLRSKKAAALKYEPGSDRAPIVVASGSGYLAERIIEIADKHEIPVYHDDNAVSLLSQLALGSEIPEELYQFIVDIYVEILKTSAKAKDGGGIGGLFDETDI